MACSDNTIRAGLTPKFKDVPTLCNSLTYRMAGPEMNKFSATPHPTDSAVSVYGPPVPEFVVHKIEVSFDFATTNPRLGPSYMIPKMM